MCPSPGPSTVEKRPHAILLPSTSRKSRETFRSVGSIVIAIDECDRTHVERVAVSMLARHPANDIVAAAALVSHMNFRTERSLDPKLSCRKFRQIIPYPIGDRLGHIASKHGWWG